MQISTLCVLRMSIKWDNFVEIIDRKNKNEAITKLSKSRKSSKQVTSKKLIAPHIKTPKSLNIT